MQGGGGDGGISSDAAATIESPPRRQVMIVLCGLIGSGKSTFAKALQDYYPDYIRCNQDLLGNRRAVVSLASRSLSSGHNVVIDRTNVDESQRATWVELGRSFPNDVEIQALVFETSEETCLARLAVRTDHETIKDPAQALRIYQQFSREFRLPHHDEGFNKIVVINPDEFASAVPTREEIDRVLIKISDAPHVDVPVVRPIVVKSAAHRVGRGRGSYRGQHYDNSWRGGSTPSPPYRGGRGGYRPSSNNQWQPQYPQDPGQHHLAGHFSGPPPQTQQYQQYQGYQQNYPSYQPDQNVGQQPFYPPQHGPHSNQQHPR